MKLLTIISSCLMFGGVFGAIILMIIKVNKGDK